MAGYSQIFWMVYGGYESSPTKKHSSRQDARNEATRLCKKHHLSFYVLEAVDVVELADDPPVKIRDLTVAF